MTDNDAGEIVPTWHKGFQTLEEARDCYQHEHTEHGKRAVKFAERIGSNRLELRRGYATVCCNCADEVKGFPRPSWPTFGGLKYTFGEDGSHSLGISRDRACYRVFHKTLTAIIDAADWAALNYSEEHIRVHRDHAEAAIGALFEFYEHDHRAAVAIAEIQRALLGLWRPKDGGVDE